jgi:hypothetical protein
MIGNACIRFIQMSRRSRRSRYEALLRNANLEAPLHVCRQKMTHRMVGLFGQSSYEYFPLPLVHSFRCSHL